MMADEVPADARVQNDKHQIDPVLLRHSIELSRAAYTQDPISFLNENAGAGVIVEKLSKAQNNRFGGDLIVATVKSEEDNLPPTLYYAFCGTQNITDWWTNIDFAPISTCFGGIHGGFCHRVSMIPVAPALEHLRRHSDGKVCFTGHSLGGACATVLCARFLAENADVDLHKRVTCITFAAPMCGMESLAAIMKSNESVFHHVIDKDDIVPKLLSIPGIILEDSKTMLLEALQSMTNVVHASLKGTDVCKPLEAVKKSAMRTVVDALFPSAQAWMQFRPMGTYHVIDTSSIEAAGKVVTTPCSALSPEEFKSLLRWEGGLQIEPENFHAHNLGRYRTVLFSNKMLNQQEQMAPNERYEVRKVTDRCEPHITGCTITDGGLVEFHGTNLEWTMIVIVGKHGEAPLERRPVICSPTRLSVDGIDDKIAPNNLQELNCQTRDIFGTTCEIQSVRINNHFSRNIRCRKSPDELVFEIMPLAFTLRHASPLPGGSESKIIIKLRHLTQQFLKKIPIEFAFLSLSCGNEMSRTRAATLNQLGKVAAEPRPLMSQLMFKALKDAISATKKMVENCTDESLKDTTATVAALGTGVSYVVESHNQYLTLLGVGAAVVGGVAAGIAAVTSETAAMAAAAITAASIQPVLLALGTIGAAMAVAACAIPHITQLSELKELIGDLDRKFNELQTSSGRLDCPFLCGESICMDVTLKASGTRTAFLPIQEQLASVERRGVGDVEGTDEALRAVEDVCNQAGMVQEMICQAVSVLQYTTMDRGRTLGDSLLAPLMKSIFSAVVATVSLPVNTAKKVWKLGALMDNRETFHDAWYDARHVRTNFPDRYKKICCHFANLCDSEVTEDMDLFVIEERLYRALAPAHSILDQVPLKCRFLDENCNELKKFPSQIQPYLLSNLKSSSTVIFLLQLVIFNVQTKLLRNSICICVVAGESNSGKTTLLNKMPTLNGQVSKSGTTPEDRTTWPTVYCAKHPENDKHLGFVDLPGCDDKKTSLIMRTCVLIGDVVIYVRDHKRPAQGTDEFVNKVCNDMVTPGSLARRQLLCLNRVDEAFKTEEDEEEDNDDGRSDFQRVMDASRSFVQSCVIDHKKNRLPIVWSCEDHECIAQICCTSFRTSLKYRNKKNRDGLFLVSQDIFDWCTNDFKWPSAAGLQGRR
eukprot:m.1638279 g.1638279  ORF g.1638279 m.1638279 type:complete len:1158 (-) comp27483_c0_seq1:136-3609(-)